MAGIAGLAAGALAVGSLMYLKGKKLKAKERRLEDSLGTRRKKKKSKKR